MSNRSMQNTVKEMGLKGYMRHHCQLLTTKNKDRVLRGKKLLLAWMKKNNDIIRIFSDEKVFTVDHAHNSRKDRYRASSVKDVLPIHLSKHPASVMVLSVMASNGKKMPLQFFEMGFRLKVDDYLEILETAVCLYGRSGQNSVLPTMSSRRTLPQPTKPLKSKSGSARISSTSGHPPCDLHRALTSTRWITGYGAP